MSIKRKMKAILLSMPMGVKFYYAVPYAYRLHKGRKTLNSDADLGYKNLCMELTSRCNYKCAYCGRYDIINKGVRRAEDGDIEIIEKTLRKVGEIAKIKSVSIGGLGEPTLHKDFSKLISIIHEIFPTAFLNMDSNFSTFNESRAKAVVGVLDSVTFSMNIPVPEDYARIEGSDTLAQAMNNFKRFMEIRRQSGSTKPSVRIQIFQGYEHRYGWLLNQFKEFDGEFAVNFKPINNFFGHLKPVEVDKTKYMTCYSILNSINTDIDGNVFACCSGFYRGKDSDTYIGNINTDDTQVMKERLEKMIEDHNVYGISKIKDCDNCDITYTMTASHLKRSIVTRKKD